MSHIRSAWRRARLVLALALAGVPAAAQAAPPPPAIADGTALTAERARLQGELDGVNAEVDALKRASRGVGDDYRLRARLADAEALARRLIDIEARLGLRAPATKPGPLPVAAPTDGPSDLEAKADIVADQSRRVRLEAQALDRRVGEAKGRQALRRRAADLDRDPFAPLEGSKRRVASISAAGADAAPRTFAPATSGASPMTPADRPVVGNSSGNSNVTGGASPGSGVVQTAGAAPGSAPPTPIAAQPPTALSLELRDLLDPATLADIRRLEAARTQGGSVQALERAVAALRARAEALDGEARAMRQSARTPR
jgi:hypothetical protein